MGYFPKHSITILWIEEILTFKTPYKFEYRATLPTTHYHQTVVSSPQADGKQDRETHRTASDDIHSRLLSGFLSFTQGLHTDAWMVMIPKSLCFKSNIFYLHYEPVSCTHIVKKWLSYLLLLPQVATSSRASPSTWGSSEPSHTTHLFHHPCTSAHDQT